VRGRVIVVGIANAPPARVPAAIPTEASSPGIETIEEVIVVVQENRSFDHYVGAYPGADGIPRD
jgi:phospholipase C